MGSLDEVRALVSRSRHGDEAAFGELVVRFSAAVRAMCTLRAADPARADDLAQQVFLTAWRRLQEQDHDVPFWPWIESITRNHLLNEWRRVQRERGLKQRYTASWLARIEAEETRDQDADTLALQVECLRECVRALPERMQELVRLRYDENWSSEQIAQQTGRSSDAVRQTLVRLRDKLRECVERRMARALETRTERAERTERSERRDGFEKLSPRRSAGHDAL
jgi:RNA polymerase sigma-70 factor (ECF subfamily)